MRAITYSAFATIIHWDDNRWDFAQVELNPDALRRYWRSQITQNIYENARERNIDLHLIPFGIIHGPDPDPLYLAKNVIDNSYLVCTWDEIVHTFVSWQTFIAALERGFQIQAIQSSPLVSSQPCLSE